MNTEFSSDTYATDNGPECVCCPGHPGLWVYLGQTCPGRTHFTGTCASCHACIEFYIDRPMAELTIADVKAGHALKIEAGKVRYAITRARREYTADPNFRARLQINQSLDRIYCASYKASRYPYTR